MGITSVINTSFTHRTKERSPQRTPMQIMAVAFAACALAFGVIAFAAGGPLPDLSAALISAVKGDNPKSKSGGRQGDSHDLRRGFLKTPLLRVAGEARFDDATN